MAKEDYWLDQQTFDRMNLARATDQVQQYIDEHVEPHLQQDLIDACQPDFTNRPGGDIHCVARHACSGSGAGRPQSGPTPGNGDQPERGLCSIQ
mmetsp:Transcript_41071/g.88243  ORF Transcript_41071/g.88243 Transcript_41071/m.88243 type:complete len:94 (+) Transcript_41071:674-955(+)